jgi:hypothetical protein
MEHQYGLFPKPEVVLSIDVSRSEPRFWIRRLAIWREPAKLIRDISLRRGLNIIWSPDPGPDAGQIGRDSESGHGAGKTLFCRLLRYCLGEETFANDELRRRISQEFPTGLVGAELAIGDSNWSVLRPIGQTRRHSARPGVTLEELIESKEPAAGIQPLLRSLNSLLSPNTLRSVLPDLQEDLAWPFVLAWLTRDQECRFDHILDWRHPRAESRSTLLSKEQALGTVRSFFGVLDSEELLLKAERSKVAEQKKSSEQDTTYLHRRAEDLKKELIPVLGIEGDVALGGVLDVSALQSAADEQMQQCENESKTHPFLPELVLIREQRDLLMQEIAVITEDVKRAEETRLLHEEQIKALRGERANLNAAEIKARLGPNCPVCRVPIDRALAEGCGLSHLFRDPENIIGEKQDVATRLQYCNEGVAASRSQAITLKSRASDLVQQMTGLDARLANLETSVGQQLREQRQKWFAARRLTENIAYLGELLDRTSRVRGVAETLNKKDEDLREEQARSRERHLDRFKRINELFSYSCRGLLGSQVSATIELSGAVLQASVQVGGQAMESLKAIAFDLTTMFLSIEGSSGLPAFCIHDSPREADLGQSIYHRLFRFIGSCEQLSTEPPFQYIITTTSAPPDELCDTPYLAARLSGSTVEERLLRANLG